jgi:hypothetical protein
MQLIVFSNSRNFSNQLRKMVQKFLFLHPDIVFAKELTNAFLSMCSCASFVWASYLADDPSQSASFYMSALDLFELCACVFFALDYFLQIILAPNKFTYLVSAAALTDFITTFPQLILFIIPLFNLSSREIEYSAKLNFLRFIRVLKILRLERIGRDKKSLQPKVFAETIVSNTVTKLALTVLTIVFIFSGIYGMVESTFADPTKLANSKQGKLDFLNCVYFVLTTMSTVGFGDIVPISVLGKFVYIILIIVTFVVVARQLDQLTTLLKSQSKFSRDSYNHSSQHVIVCGDVNHVSLKVFLDEFTHKDHYSTNIRVVVLSNSDPDWDTQILLDSSAFQNVKYITGSPLEQNDLLRCKISKASCIFVLNEPGLNSVVDSDNRCILRALSVSAVIPPESGPLLVLQMQSMLSKRRFLSIATSKLNVQIICWEELRPSILSACCENPCFGVFLFNWIKSFNHFESPFMMLRRLGWQEEYIHGKGFEIYTASLNGYGNSMFHAVAAYLYMKFCVILIAVISAKEGTILAPFHFVFGMSPTTVYVLAEDESFVKELQKFDPNLNNDWKSFLSEFRANGPGFSASTCIDALPQPHPDGGKKSAGVSAFQSAVSKTKLAARTAKKFAVAANPAQQSEVSHIPGVVAPKIISRSWSVLRRAVTVGAVLKAGLRFSTTMTKEQYSFLLESELNPKYNRLSSQLYFHVSDENNFENINLGVSGRFEGHGHIIYCCRQAIGMRRFIAPLRSKHRTRVTPVVILCSSISEKEMVNIAIFPSVFVIIGNALTSTNLLRASVTTAKVAVICMSQNISSPLKQSTDSDLTVDASVIFLYNLIKSLNPNCSLISEMKLLENSKYLEDNPRLKGSRDFGELFSAGNIFPEAFFTTLLCQCFFNPTLPTLITELLRPSPISSLASRVQPSVLLTFPAPSSLWGKPVSQVFSILCQADTILLGIIRAPNKRSLIVC